MKPGSGTARPISGRAPHGTAGARGGEADNRNILNAVTLLYVASVPWDIIPVAFGRTLTGPLALLLMAVWVISNLSAPEATRLPRSMGVLLYLYGTWMVCTLLWSVDFPTGFGAVQTYLLQLPVVVILANCLPRQWLRSLVALGCSTAVLGAVILLQPANAMQAGRTALGDVDNNITAMVLVVGLAALTYCVTNLGGRRAALLVVPAVVVVIAVLRTGSRTGAIAVIGLFVVALLSSVLEGRVRPAGAFRTLGVVLLAWYVFVRALGAGLVPQRVVEVLGFGDLAGQGSALDDSGRSAIIEAYQRSFAHWAFFGVGVGNDAYYLQLAEGIYRNAHGLLWKTWIETGIVGVALLGAILVVSARSGIHCASPRALVLLSVPIAAFAFTLGGGNTSAFWYVLAFALARGPARLQATEEAAARAGSGTHSGRSGKDIGSRRSGPTTGGAGQEREQS